MFEETSSHLGHLYFFKVLGAAINCFLFIELEETEIDSKSISQLCKNIDMVKRLMIKTDYGAYNGEVYGKLLETVYKYIFYKYMLNALNI